MPAVPHYPSDEPTDRKERSDFDEIVDRILDRDDPTPTPSAV